jgi:hypothetical protein
MYLNFAVLILAHQPPLVSPNSFLAILPNRHFGEKRQAESRKKAWFTVKSIPSEN